MRSYTRAITALAAATLAAAQRPANVSMCNYYTDAVFNTTNANSTLQYGLLTALVNTAVIGNYSTNPGSLVAVTGILNNGTFNNQDVSLLQYFSGMLASTNRGGDSGVSVSFLDGGGADPLKASKPANDTMSNQYFLLTHLYEYFGALLNCSGYDSDAFAKYGGDESMYQVHKFMDLDENEVGYFIQEVGLAAKSFGVTDDDVAAVGKSLNSIFNVRCAPKTTVIPAQGAQLQSICIADSCPQAPNAACALYEKSDEPSPSNSSNVDTTKPTMMPSGGSSTDSGSMASGTSSSDSGSDSDSAGSILSAVDSGALALGVAGFFALAAGL